MTFLTFIFRRSRHYWLLLLTLVLGIVLATTFLASGPILIDALMEYGLRRTLLNANAREDILYLSARESADRQVYQSIDDALGDFIKAQLWHQDIRLITAGHVGFMYPWQKGRLSLDQPLTLGFYGRDFEELNQHVDFVDGVFPDAESQKPYEIPVFIGKFLANDLAIQVGDRLPVSIGTRAVQPDFYLPVTGIITPKDFHDPYWLDHFTPFWPVEGAGDAVLYGVFVEWDIFFNLAYQQYPSLDVSYYWLTNLELDQVAFENIAAMQSSLSTLREEVLSISDKMRVNTTLIEILSDYSIQANIVRAPLYFLLGIVVLMALYYLVMMSSLYLEQVRSELAILRSRGASGGLLFKMEVLNGIFLGAIAILSGPFLAWVIVRWMTSNGPLAALANQAGGYRYRKPPGFLPASQRFSVSVVCCYRFQEH